MFQSLIGKIQTICVCSASSITTSFQSLIGKIQTQWAIDEINTMFKFQSLIGKIQTGAFKVKANAEKRRFNPS